MIVVDAQATREALGFDRLVPALRAQFAAGCEAPPRHVHDLGAEVVSLLMPAWQPGGLYGVKVVNVAGGNAARGLPGVQASYLLHDARTGVPLALIDGGELTARRSAATSALAADALVRTDATRLLVVGAGRIAALLPAALCGVRPSLTRVTVWARRAAQAHALADAWCHDGIDARAAPDLAAAVRDADVVCCATNAHEPLVHGRWLAPGTHLDLIGSYTPAMREADDDCLGRADGVWVDTDEALHKSGDLLGPLSRGVLPASRVRGTLAQLARGEVAGRTRADQRTVFKSVGSALADLAAASLIAAGLRITPGSTGR